jgi:hypothetical protein
MEEPSKTRLYVRLLSDPTCPMVFIQCTEFFYFAKIIMPLYIFHSKNKYYVDFRVDPKRLRDVGGGKVG